MYKREKKVGVCRIFWPFGLTHAGEAYSSDNRIPHDLCCQRLRKDRGRRWVIKQRLEKPKEGFGVQEKAVQPKEGADSTKGRWGNP